ncbi:MAG: hypothetical protein JL50_07715 [Peptococcaceae bacterium BICA1-7]|nr:MAG: hypothetical protein JL50_07715 [Peptococcaceae bacterium BICA1-7]HBV97872.1 hypothetical protein [Desulfotomaculum sp.]
MESEHISDTKNEKGVLSLIPYASYFSCPPVTGGARHILKTLTALANSGKYLVSLLVPVTSPEKARQVTAYLKGAPGFRKVWGVECERECRGGSWERDTVPGGAVYLYCSSLYREALSRVLRENAFHIVLVETSDMLWTVPLIRKIQPWAKIVLNLQNADSLLMRRMVENGGLTGRVREKYLMEYHKAIAWEKRFWPAVDYCLAVSSQEALMFRSLAPGVPVEVVVAGGGVEEVASPAGFRPGIAPLDISFVGTMWYPNIHGILWFVESVFPEVVRNFPKTRLHVLGSGRPPANFIERLGESGSVVFWGRQEDERSILASTSVFIVPLFIGAGARIKIMTAWSLGIPVVSTTIGAEGLDCEGGRDILIADTTEGFACCVMSLLKDPRLRKKLAAGGRAIVKKLYSETAAAERVTVFFDMVSSSRKKHT